MANSKPWLDEALRDLYRQDHDTCELLPWMEGESWERLVENYELPWSPSEVRVHHIWSNNQRPDVWSNFVAVCDPVHAWIHAYPAMGRTLCVWWKLRKKEFDIDEMRDVAGKHPIGALDLYGDDAFEPWALDLKNLLVKEMF